MPIFLDTPVKRNCYAIGWSYGEICVHCGCCSEDPIKRTKARIEYCEWELEEKINFNHWAYDYPKLLEIQKQNVAKDIEHFKKELKKLRSKLKDLESEGE